MAIGDSRLIVNNRLDRYVRHENRPLLGATKLENRLDRYIQHDRYYVAPSKLELPALERRVKRTAKLAAVQFVPRDWVGAGCAFSFLTTLLDDAKGGA